jgi:hypothetical protein
MLTVVLSGCETWSLTPWEEQRLRLFENKVLRRIFGPKREDIMGGWRKVYNEKLHNLFSSPYIITVIKTRTRLAVHIKCMEEMINVYKILI